MSLPQSDPSERSVGYILTSIDQRLESMEKAMSKFDHLLTGNGTPEKGVIVRLDRIEQDNQRRENWSKSAVGAAIAASVAALGAWLKG